MGYSFPIRLSIAALFSTVALFVGQIFLLQKAHNELEKIQSTEFPLLQVVSSSLRLAEQANHMMVFIISEKKLDTLEEYLNTEDAFVENMDQMEELKSHSSIADAPILYDDLKMAFSIDNELFKLCQNQDWKTAEKVYYEKYLPEIVKTREALSQIAFSLSTQHEKNLSSNNKTFFVFLIASSLALAFILGFWTLVFRAYQSSNIARLAAENTLETERARNIQTAKLSSLGEMAGGVAHEINNPLAIIRGTAELHLRRIQMDKATNESLKEAFEKILSTIDRMAKIVKALRTFARDGQNDSFETTPVKQIVDDVMAFSAERLKANEVHLRLKLEPNLSFDCQLIQIEQVVLNLLNNAFDAVLDYPEKWVEIEAYRKNDDAYIHVTDSGKGIPDEVVQKLMSPFFTTKEVGKGTGLGLSVSSGIAKMHNGSLYYDKDCKNTRFTLKIPIHHQEEQSKAA